MAVERTREWIEREYGREQWPLTRDAIAAAPDEAPSRVMAGVVRAAGDQLTPADCVVDGRIVRLPPAAVLGAFQALVVEAVVDACRPDTGLVLELGSGWGRNLGRIWLEGGPLDAAYVAAEFTRAGREASEELAARLPGADLRAVPFDYHLPDLAPLRRDAGHAVVLTVHSIEQIAHLPAAVLDEILGLAPAVTVVHVEPVGHQLPDAGDGSSLAYAEQHDYNRDLVAVLRAAEQAGRLQIHAVLPNVVGMNPANASSLIVWSAA